jgi:uncharacterized membrane protein
MHSGFTPIILTHMLAAFAALALGTLVFARRKGDTTHRMAGRVWAGMMLVTAVSSFWIQSTGGFSWIHGLSVVALILLGRGVWLAIRGNVARHRRVMQGLYGGALVLAGLFTLMPHRLLGRASWDAAGLA